MPRFTQRLALALALLASACAPTVQPPAAPERLSLAPVDFAQLPGWAEDHPSAALPALRKSCERITRLPFDRALGPDGVAGTAADWFGPCGTLKNLEDGDDAAARAFLEQWFSPFRVAGEGLFTGYFEPELRGSRTRFGPYAIPLYGKPVDLVSVDLGKFRPEWQGEFIAGRLNGARLEPYPTRAEIEAGAIDDKAKVVAWVDDAVDAHILHIQGSGRIRMEDGSVMRLSVAGTNGHKFTGIGKVLKDKGVLDGDTSMPAIRAWLKSHPDEAAGLMAQNPRYIFYSLNLGDGPIGTEGVALTPERSVAVDPKFIPLGVPLWLDTLDPAGAPLRRLMVAQDTGAAIKGPVRGDVFWGAGDAAFDKAGRMKSRGVWYLLLPRQRSPRLAAN